LDIVVIGIPGAIVTLCLAIRWYALNGLLLKYEGNDGVSAISALNSCGGILYAITAGVASATRLLVSVYIGEEDRTSLILTMKTALYKGVAMVCGLAVLVFIFAAPFTGIFFADNTSNAYKLAYKLFRIFPFSMPLSAICVVFINYYQSSSRMKIVHVLSIMDGLVGTVISSLILINPMGAVGVWLAHVLNGIYTTVIIYVYACIFNRRIVRDFNGLLAMPKEFGVPDDQRLDITIHNMEEVTETSEQVMNFCQRVGIDRKRAFYSGLCLEEMAANIVKHGFGDRRKHSVDVRVVNKSDGLMLRVKDDCRAFNPKEKLELINPEDHTHNIGLRMVDRLAKDMTYSNILGLNVLTMVL